ncbi:hypothetical protein Mpt1_c00930 [Candidatus Methanoplasma termitum]|uniref:The GLUG motif protein n=1 Tax=Candidatus Methanoplasma termitum TaxID=1577791 RepID=A0A0A7LAE9_9ARCH|nr:hypothetical protein [Candidatus Methanoplasma termitum]AIZ55998.1 hypothetical protein Mpt1_c00930 [Candidatus Methanoplasma termitum]MCL2333952.1 hypothetical protein [Candidatus Methanoplasma sp.]
MKKISSLLCVITLVMLVFASLVPVALDKSESSAANNFNDGTWKPISNYQDLAKIGNDGGYPLDGKYYLTRDIDFNGDTNGGTNINITVKKSGSNSLSIELTPSVGRINDLQAWYGTVSKNNSIGEITLDNISSGSNMLYLGGYLDGYPFAYSVWINSAVSGGTTIINNVTFNSNGNFTPIGTDKNPFTGTFDGNGHRISGMNTAIYVTSNDFALAGLFGYTLNANFSNLGIVNGSATAITSGNGYASAGGISAVADANRTDPVTIDNCYNTSHISSITAYQGSLAGGIIGIVGALTNNSLGTSTGPGAIISNCYNKGTVSASSTGWVAFAGGISGDTEQVTTLSYIECYNSGTVNAVSTASDAVVGGITGLVYAEKERSNTLFSKCYNTGITSSESTTKGWADSGGIAGSIMSSQSASVSISECYNTGSGSSTSSYAYGTEAGGIIGYVYSEIGSRIKVADCYNTGSISVKANNYPCAGGVIGYAESGSSGLILISNCYNDGAVATLSGTNQCSGGIVGRSYIETGVIAIVNCYFTSGKVVKGDTANEVLYNEGKIWVDGNSNGSPRAGAQGSGSKSLSDMKPSSSDAKGGNSIYYIGTTTIRTDTISGWDFDNVWTLGTGSGLPILSYSVESKNNENKREGGGGGSNIALYVILAIVIIVILIEVIWFLFVGKGKTFFFVELFKKLSEIIKNIFSSMKKN